MDWLPILKGQAKIVTRLVKLVPACLARPDLSLDQALHIHDVVEEGARAFQGLLDNMRAQKAEERSMRAARVIEALWDDLCTAAALKVRDIRIAIHQPVRRQASAISSGKDGAPPPSDGSSDTSMREILDKARSLGQRISSAGAAPFRGDFLDRGRAVLAGRANAIAAALEEMTDRLKAQDKRSEAPGKGWLKPNQIVS